MEKITVLIADDHTLLRQGLVKLLEMEPCISVVGQAINGEEAYVKALELQPDIALMDINMPKLNGIQAARLIRKKCPNTHILALTIHDDEEYISEMIRAGARGYLLKDSESTNVIHAIKRVVAGETFFPSHLMERVMERFHQLVADQDRVQVETAATAESLLLTPRESEILECIVDGLSNKEIASKLFISEKTVKNHITNLLRKLNVQDRTQAAVYAVKNQVVKARD